MSYGAETAKALHGHGRPHLGFPFSGPYEDLKLKVK